MSTTNILWQHARMKAAIQQFADDNDYCIVCDNHQSSGHSRDCPLYTEPTGKDEERSLDSVDYRESIDRDKAAKEGR